MQDRVGRSLHRLSTHLSARRMEQRQEFGGSSPDIFMRTPRRFALRLPGSAGLRDRLIGTGFILAPNGNACLFG
jgi:hypothetical protein